MKMFIEKLGNLVQDSDYSVRLVILIRNIKQKLQEVACEHNITFDRAVKDAKSTIDLMFANLGMNKKLIDLALVDENDEIIRGLCIAKGLEMLNCIFWRSFNTVKP